MTIRFSETPDRIIVYVTEGQIVTDFLVQEADSHFDICNRATVDTKRLVIDFRDVVFMTSPMIGNLVLINKLAKQNSLELRLARVGHNVLEVFKITQLHKVFRMDDDDPGPLGSGVPNADPPSTLEGHSEPTSS